MLQSFTRNYEDNSTEAGFQFAFYCDLCQDGYKSSFVESTTYRKTIGFRGITRGAGVLGSFLGGRLGDLGWSLERGGDVLSERFSDMSPEWQKEHEAAFRQAQKEVQGHFHRCHGCHQWVCDSCYNEAEMLCVDCSPREEISAAKAKAAARQRNIEEAADAAVVWKGSLTDRIPICPSCGKPAGSGRFCSQCGAPLAQAVCPSCGTGNAPGVHFCSQCGAALGAAAAGKCPGCGAENPPGTRFCGSCGKPL